EETNLADELRDALADGDRDTMMQLVAMLALFWSIRGEHGRIAALTGAIADVVGDWTPPPELEEPARAGASILLSNSLAVLGRRTARIRGLLQRLGPGEGDGRMVGMVRVMLAFDPHDPGAFATELEQLTQDPDRDVARTAWHWLSHARENAGDPAGAVA